MDNWIEEVFKSLQNQKQLTLQVDLFSKIEHKINIEEAKIKTLTIWKVTAAACLILSINVFGMKAIKTINKNKQVEEYHYTDNYNLYGNE